MMKLTGPYRTLCVVGRVIFNAPWLARNSEPYRWSPALATDHVP
jgi:hypothetical protein